MVASIASGRTMEVAGRGEAKVKEGTEGERGCGRAGEVSRGRQVEVFYDAVLEPFFNAAVPILAELKRSSPSVLSWTGVVLADVLIGVGFATFCLAPLIVKALISASVVLLGLRAFRRPCAKVD
eukprot:2924643-Pleurochrysis_carterae.AAC.7